MKVKIVGVPSYLGANCRGVDMGPSAVRYAGLIKMIRNMGIDVEDAGDVNIPNVESKDLKTEDINYLDEIIEICEDLSNKVEVLIKDNIMPIILGGDHSISIGSVGGLAKAKDNIGLIWIDAHGDFNTHETTCTGNIHGMSLATLVGRGLNKLVEIGGITPKVKEENVVLIGVRDLDRSERDLLLESKVTVFTMDDIDRMGIAEVMQKAIVISSKDTKGVHLSFDMDVLDPLEAPGVGTPVKGGINYREAHLALEMIAEADILTSIELVEVNPILDRYNRTAELAVDLITSALGKRIL
ncbi:arginase [Orenia metallireducens]|uniref:Arginase n=1 Tax=Orenia metallireducens TaxID=1413210 RepID=A0A285H7G0_9FIRM|nr:arginase [Orenia metallireducens]PRX26240.1 arginase [Orenia metallireducens]SNY31692.1 arginase [Orenia metallireducens]